MQRLPSLQTTTEVSSNNVFTKRPENLLRTEFSNPRSLASRLRQEDCLPKQRPLCGKGRSLSLSDPALSPQTTPKTVAFGICSVMLVDRGSVSPSNALIISALTDMSYGTAGRIRIQRLSIRNYDERPAATHPHRVQQKAALSGIPGNFNRSHPSGM